MEEDNQEAKWPKRVSVNVAAALAVEGGVIALEVLVARPQQPDVNLLGERENGVEYPFVITVEELERGLAHSKFGTVRKPHLDDIALNVKIERFRLGKGVGSGSTYCSNCSNLQELSNCQCGLL